MLPYQSLLQNPRLQGEDLKAFVAVAPGDHFDEFSNGSEHVGNDAAIAALSELTRVVRKLQGVVDGPWDRAEVWLSTQLANIWKLRGAYPGLGSALTAAGMERGALIAHRVIESLADPGEDPWPAIGAAVSQAASGKGPAAGLVGRMARKVWEGLQQDPDRLLLLKLIARFSLSVDQATRIFDPERRRTSGVAVTDQQLLANPYVIFEVERGRVDPVRIDTIDRGMFPRDANARRTLDQAGMVDPIEEATDDRRVRAACIDVLEDAAAGGHTLLDEATLRRGLSTLQLDPPCDPTTAAFNVAVSGFAPLIQPSELARGIGRGWQLDRLAQARQIIADDVEARLKSGPLSAAWDWRAAIDTAIPMPPDPNDPLEEAARTEKAAALKVLARSRISALVGPAGTGKTTMLQALCVHRDVKGYGVLLLAPTGKARVQLGDKVGARALTLAQYLRSSGRWDDEFGYRVVPGAKRDGAYRTVVVDEASMLTEEMLAALIDATTGVERLVLCGDHRQLPPIGPGRPFADLVAYFQSRSVEEQGPAAPESGGGLAELQVGRRIRRGKKAAQVPRDDLAVASWFSVDGSSPAADEAFARVLAGDGDGTVTVTSWTDEHDLHEKVSTFLEQSLGIKRGDADALKRSLGATELYKGRASFPLGNGGVGAEEWQILSPVRARAGGIAGLNRVVRLTWRAGDATVARSTYALPPPAGADEILFHDKVMCATNHRRQAFDTSKHEAVGKSDVANGEIGMAVGWHLREGLKVEFSTQPDLRFTFWINELNGEGERTSELLNLAYAITIHKAQGSQFRVTLIVLPNPCPLLSPELVYTALTRHRDRSAIFVQGDPNELRVIASPSRSETARRLTCLFRPADPFLIDKDVLIDGAHVHRTARGEMVRSKSEVIVANVLRGIGIDYLYEEQLRMPDGSVRSPDFTITRTGKVPVYWEHLGMLDLHGYRADWDAKTKWYAAHGIRPWDEGGGPAGTLVWSKEGEPFGGIDAKEIEELARRVFDV